VIGLGHLEAGDDLVKFLAGDGALLEQVAHPPVGGPSQLEIGLGGADGVLHLVHGVSRFGQAGLGGAQGRFLVPGVKQHEKIACAHGVTGLDAHLAHVPHHLARDRGAGPGVHGAYGLQSRRPFDRLDDQSPDGDGRSRGRHSGLLGCAAAARQQDDQQGDRQNIPEHRIEPP